MIVDAQGRTSFQKLQRAMGKATTIGFAYEVFDLIYLNGLNLTSTPLIDRKALLKGVVGSATRGVVRYSEHIQGSGDEFFKHACEYGIEGIVSKLANSRYESTRNRNWLKVKCIKPWVTPIQKPRAVTHTPQTELNELRWKPCACYATASATNLPQRKNGCQNWQP